MRTECARSRFRLLAASAILLTPSAMAAGAEEPTGPPAWFLEHVEFMTRDGGRWIADNAEYRSEQEPYDAYGMVWEKAIDGHSLKRRLFGLAEGREVATFWEFRFVWHPGEKQVQALQWGRSGVYGSGTMEGVGGRTHRVEQRFFRPDGSSVPSGHESTEREDGTYFSQSYEVAPDGSWTPSRSYLWRLSGA